MFRRTTLIGAGTVPRPLAVRSPPPGRYNGAVAGEGDPDDAGGDRGGGGRTRPEFFTPQAKAVLAIWVGVTLVLIAIYAIVLLFL